MRIFGIDSMPCSDFVYIMKLFCGVHFDPLNVVINHKNSQFWGDLTNKKNTGMCHPTASETIVHNPPDAWYLHRL